MKVIHLVPRAHKRPQPSKSKGKKPRKDPRIEYTYEKEYRYYCPVRGWVVQKVTVKHMRARYAPPLKGYVPAIEPELKELIDDSELSVIDQLPGSEDGSDN